MGHVIDRIIEEFTALQQKSYTYFSKQHQYMAYMVDVLLGFFSKFSNVVKIDQSEQHIDGGPCDALYLLKYIWSTQKTKWSVKKLVMVVMHGKPCCVVCSFVVYFLSSETFHINDRKDPEIAESVDRIMRPRNWVQGSLCDNFLFPLIAAKPKYFIPFGYWHDRCSPFRLYKTGDDFR